MDKNKIGEVLLRYLAEKDFASVPSVFHPNVRGRLMTPNAIFTTYDVLALAGKLNLWFGDTDHFELLESQISGIGSSLGVRYKFKAHKNGKWSEIEQQTYSVIEDGEIVSFNLLCSGFNEINV